MKTLTYWKSEYCVPSRKTPICIHILAHTWYRARNAAEVVGNRIAETQPKARVSLLASFVERQAGPLKEDRAARGDYLAIADETGGIRVFRAKAAAPLARILKQPSPSWWKPL